MQHYELTQSKSSSAIVMPNRHSNLIDCFRRFAGKSKSKKRLFNFGFSPKNNGISDAPLNIDQKQKSRRFGSTPNVHSCRTEFLNFSPCVEVPSSNSNVMNQSCYGGFPIQTVRPREVQKFKNENYDNMTSVGENESDERGSVRRMLVNRRSRKAVSEVGCPITVVEVGNLRRVHETSETKVCWRNRVDPKILLKEQRHTQYFDTPKHPSIVGIEPSNRPNYRRRFSNNINTGNTGSNQSSVQSPLPSAITRPAIDFFGANSAFGRSDGSSSTDSNGMSDKKKSLNGPIGTPTQYGNEIDSFNGTSRSSSLAGQIHCDPIQNLQNHSVENSHFNPNFGNHHARQTSFENDMFYGVGNMRSGPKQVNSNDELLSENLKLNQRIQEHMRTIDLLKTQLKNEQKRSEAEKQSLINEHRDELKKKDCELVEKEISVIQRFGLSTPSNMSEISFNKLNLSESTPTNGSLNNSNGPMRPQSLYINSRSFASNDLISKDRHRAKALTDSSNQLYVSRSSSTTPDSGAMSASPNLIALFRDLTTAAFHLHNSCDTASKFTNDWLKNIRPQICNPTVRAAFVEILSKVEQMQGEDMEHILEQTVKLLKDGINTQFGLRRDLAELYKRGVWKSSLDTTEST